MVQIFVQLIYAKISYAKVSYSRRRNHNYDVMFKLSHVFIFACKVFMQNIRKIAPYENFPLYGTGTATSSHLNKAGSVP